MNSSLSLVSGVVKCNVALALDVEHKENYVPYPFLVSGSGGVRIRGQIMVRSVVEEALALASISLFLATVAVWAQVLGVI
jgi:hypothetical protein